MAPRRGSIHQRPRRDSGAVILWRWLRSRRSAWTVGEAAEASGLSPRRSREIVAALYRAGLIDQVAEQSLGDAGRFSPAEYRVSAAGRTAAGDPVLVVNGATGRVVGVRMGSTVTPP